METIVRRRVLVALAAIVLSVGDGLAAGQPVGAPGARQTPAPVTIRVATFNVHDLRTGELADPANPRARRLAEIIQRVRPNVLLLNEITYDIPGAPEVTSATESGRNAQRFADRFLAVAQATDVEPLRFRAFMALTNSGMPSGLDLDRDGQVATTYPPPAAPGEDASEASRKYGDDCWGFGAFPGQYGMALLVDERLEILTDQVRTFRLFPWDYLTGAFTPVKEDGRSPWYSPDELAVVRLSSKSHWDVPVRLPGGAVVHFLCSHPTPPAFDGPERRNARRNHDEIRFWADYIAGDSAIVDDRNNPGGLDFGASFVILGDLNADPDEGESFKDPIGTVLLTSGRVAKVPAPAADVPVAGLDADDTASFGLRVDYIIPSDGLEVRASGVWRTPPAARQDFPSDHFPVWADIVAGR